jgi:acyl-CoA dehydrogenase
LGDASIRKREESLRQEAGEHPLYLRDLVEMEAKLRAVLLLTLTAAKAFSDVAPGERPPYSQA